MKSGAPKPAPTVQKKMTAKSKKLTKLETFESTSSTMSRPKKPRLLEERSDTHVGGGDNAVIERSSPTVDDLSAEMKAIIFGYFGPAEIMCLRCVCKKWSEAAKKTIVPQAPFSVSTIDTLNAMGVMTRELPNLQRLSILYLENFGNIFDDGEDPNIREAYKTARYTSHDIQIISRFSKLRSLDLFQASMNGRYPFLFTSFPLLQKLGIGLCDYLKFDLAMLAGFPLLEELEITHSPSITGNINSLRVLKDTLEKVHIESCRVGGNFMDLADFPHMRELHLIDVAVTGDVRDIGENDFTHLEQLSLPKGVVGGTDHKFLRISDVPEVMQAIYRLKDRVLSYYEWDSLWLSLSDRSPDWYDDGISSEFLLLHPPFSVELVQAGTRHGWRWYGRSYTGTISHSCVGTASCEINWLDPEPDRESSDYENYEQKLQQLEQEINFYRGYLQPPTEGEYNRICREFIDRS